MMVIGGASDTGSSAEICLADPKPERLKSAFEPGKSVRVTLDGAVDELRLRDGHADLSLNVHGCSVRPEGRRTISSLIEEKQKKAVR